MEKDKRKAKEIWNRTGNTWRKNVEGDTSEPALQSKVYLELESELKARKLQIQWEE